MFIELVIEEKDNALRCKKRLDAARVLCQHDPAILGRDLGDIFGVDEATGCRWKRQFQSEVSSEVA